jgi:hypothetical protein
VVDGLTTHVVALSRADAAIQQMLHHPEQVLGVVFDMKG